MPYFSLLVDPATYRPCPIDMLVDIEFRDHWMNHFAEHFAFITDLAVKQYGPARAGDAQACLDDLRQEIELLRREPGRMGELNLLVLDMMRQEKLLDHGFADPFAAMKARENAAMLAHYPQVIGELDSHEADDPLHTLLLLVEGVFAGNIFDMGTAATVARFSQKSVDFISVRNSLEDTRPWLVDHFDAWGPRAARGEYRKVVYFLDNAGSDVVLGALPLARWLARHGATVVLAANDLPALNDVTAAEVRALLTEAAAMDAELGRFIKEGKIVAANSGGVAPLIDLREVSAELNAAADGADLVILEGMGRAVGSNFDAQFSCDSVKICMLKDPMIAQRLGGKVYDTVLRFDPAATRG